MLALEQNKHFQLEVAAFLMSDGETVFWNNYLDNVSTSAQIVENYEASEGFSTFKRHALGFKTVANSRFD